MSVRNSKLETQLREAKSRKFIIQFSRPFEPGTFTGYVMDVRPKFFLLASLDDAIQFEQYTCLRIADIRRLEAPAKRDHSTKQLAKCVTISCLPKSKSI